MLDPVALEASLAAILADAQAERSSVAVLALPPDVSDQLAVSRRSSDMIGSLPSGELVVVCPRVEPSAGPARIVERLLPKATSDPVDLRGAVVTASPADRPTTAGAVLDAARAALQDLLESEWEPELEQQPEPEREPEREPVAAYAPLFELRRAALAGVVVTPDGAPGSVGAMARHFSAELADRVLFDASGWLSDLALPDGFRVWFAVTSDFLGDHDAADALGIIAAKYGVPPDVIGVVVAAGDGAALAPAVVEELTGLGSAVAVDPSGTRVGELSELFDLSLQAMWVPATTPLEDRHAAVVRGLVALARDLGLDVVAGSLDDADAARLLRGLGYTHGWGELFGVGFSAEQVGRMLMARR